MFNFTSIESFLTSLNEHAYDMIMALIKIAVIIVGYLLIKHFLFKIIAKSVNSAISKLKEDNVIPRTSRLRALQSIACSVISFILGFVAMVMILEAFGVNIMPLITTAGVAGLAVGFGAQKLVKDIISGFCILIEDQYGVGDRVTVNGVTGEVEELGMRITRIRDNNGGLHVISNGDVTSVCNLSRGRFILEHDVPVSARSNVELAMSVLNNVCSQVSKQLPGEIIEPFNVAGIVQSDGETIRIRLKGAVVPKHEGDVQVALNAAIKNEFDKNNIAFANLMFPFSSSK